MKCPKCGLDNNMVIDTRERKDFHRRVRQCIECGHKFYTREVVVDTGYTVEEKPAPKWINAKPKSEVDWKAVRDRHDEKMKQIDELIKSKQ